MMAVPLTQDFFVGILKANYGGSVEAFLTFVLRVIDRLDRLDRLDRMTHLLQES